MAGCRKLLAAALLLTISFRSLFAQGTEALPFTRIGLDPERSALAGAGASFVQNGAYTAFSGASALPFCQQTLDAAISYRLWAPAGAKSNLVNAAVAYKPIERLGISLGYSFQGGQALASGDTPKAHLVALGVGFGITPRVSVGLNARYALQQLTAAQRYGGFSADVFVNWRPLDVLGLSAGIAHLGTTVRSQMGDTYTQPAHGRLGIDWTQQWGAEKAHETRLLVDGEFYFSGNMALSVGAQYAWNRLLYARAGYHLASEKCVIPSHLSLGLGVHWKGLRLDVSWLTASKVLNNTLAVGLGYSF